MHIHPLTGAQIDFRIVIRHCPILLSLLLSPSAIGQSPLPPPIPTIPANPVTADTDSANALPDATKLLQSFIRAVGGEVAIHSIQTMEVQGQIRLPGGRAPGQFHWVVASGGRAFFQTQFPGLGRSAFGSDGDTGWSLLELPGDHHSEAVPLVDIERRRQRANWFELAFTLPRRATAMHTVGPVEFEGTPAWEVSLERIDGRTERLFLDRASELLLGVTTAIDTDPKSPKITVRFSDWRPVGDLRLFHRIVIAGGRTRVQLDITKVSMNDVDDAIFAPPDDLVTTEDDG